MSNEMIWIFIILLVYNIGKPIILGLRENSGTYKKNYKPAEFFRGYDEVKNIEFECYGCSKKEKYNTDDGLNPFILNGRSHLHFYKTGIASRDKIFLWGV